MFTYWIKKKACLMPVQNHGNQMIEHRFASGDATPAEFPINSPLHPPGPGRSRPVMTSATSIPAASAGLTLSSEEEKILKAVRDLTFGTVEIIVHDRRITEIRQTRRTRLGHSSNS